MKENPFESDMEKQAAAKACGEAIKEALSQIVESGRYIAQAQRNNRHFIDHVIAKCPTMRRDILHQLIEVGEGRLAPTDIDLVRYVEMMQGNPEN